MPWVLFNIYIHSESTANRLESLVSFASYEGKASVSEDVPFLA